MRPFLEHRDGAWHVNESEADAHRAHLVSIVMRGVEQTGQGLVALARVRDALGRAVVPRVLRRVDTGELAVVPDTIRARVQLMFDSAVDEVERLLRSRLN